MGPYWKGRKEKTIIRTFKGYCLRVRYLEDCDRAQVTMEDLSRFRLPLMWSATLSDEQANGALKLFESIGYFDKPLNC